MAFKENNAMQLSRTYKFEGQRGRTMGVLSFFVAQAFHTEQLKRAGDSVSSTISSHMVQGQIHGGYENDKKGHSVNHQRSGSDVTVKSSSQTILDHIKVRRNICIDIIFLADNCVYPESLVHTCVG